MQSCAVAKLFLSLPSLQRLDAVIKLQRSHTERETFIKLHAIMRHDLLFPETGTSVLAHLHSCAVEQSHNCKFTTSHICTDGQTCNYYLDRLLLAITTSLHSCVVAPLRNHKNRKRQNRKITQTQKWVAAQTQNRAVTQTPNRTF